MTQEDKQLLLKDLNARLPYGVYVEHTTTKIIGKLKSMFFEHIYNNTDSIQDINAWIKFFGDEYVDATYFRPILRPMSSMTEEERKEYNELVSKLGDKEPYFVLEQMIVDFYHKRHLDNRLLIEKGLAIEAKEEMY